MFLMQSTLLFLLLLVYVSELPAQVLETSLIAHYTFNNTATDVSPNANNGALQGTINPTEDRFGNKNGAIHLDGTTAYIQVPHSSSLSKPTVSLTITAWIKLDKTESNNTQIPLLSKGDNAPQYSFELNRTFGNLYSEIKLTSQQTIKINNYSNYALEFNEWYFISISLEDGWVYFYVNGKLAGQEMCTKPFVTNTSDLWIGKAYNHFFKGSLDDLRIYKSGLSASEINQLYKDQTDGTVSEEIKIVVPEVTQYLNETGSCGAVVNYGAVTATAGGNATTLKLVEGAASGSFFNVGKTIVKYEANTASGTAKTDSFIINVFDAELPTFKCPTNMLMQADTNSLGAEVQYEVLGYDNCKGVKIKLVAGLNSGALFPIGITQVKYLATDKAGNKADCNFEITVLAPKKLTPEKLITEEPVTIAISTKIEKTIERAIPKPNVFDESIPVAVVTKIEKTVASITEKKPAIVAKPIQSPAEEKVVAARDVFESVERKPEPTIVEKQPSIEPPAKSEIKAEPIRVIETPKNDVIDTKKTIPLKAWQITFTNDIAKGNEKGKCGAKVNYLSPHIAEIQSLKVVQKTGLRSGSFFNVGSTQNLFSATDANDLTKETAFSIHIKDTENPVFDCPQDTTIFIPLNRRGIIYTYQTPQAKDNCGIDTIIQTLGSKSGCFLELGVHPFTFSATDKAGNIQLCTHSVLVREVLNPVTSVVVMQTALELVAPKILDPSLDLGKDTVKYEYMEHVNNCTLTAYIYDDGEEDGDVVSVLFNGQIIVNKQTIRLKENGAIKYMLNLKPNEENYLISKAWNTGKYGSNTLKIDVYEGDVDYGKKDLKIVKPVFSKVLHSKPGTAGGMLLLCK